MKEMTIDGIVYVPKITEGETLRLVITDTSGLTFVGWTDFNPPGDRLRIRDAQCVIRWGTEKHLAELANKGPLQETILGDRGDVYVNKQRIIADYECSAKWEAHKPA